MVFAILSVSREFCELLYGFDRSIFRSTEDVHLEFVEKAENRMALRADMSRTVVGVTRYWQLNHGGNMLTALAQLAKPNVNHAEVLFLQKGLPGTPGTGWFSLLGYNIVEFTPPGVSSPATKKLDNFPLFHRKGDVITLSLSGTSSFKVPMLCNVRYVGVAADPGSTVRFTDETWKKYDAVSVSTSATPSKPLAIHFPSLVYPGRLTAVSGVGDDLVIVDSNVGTSLTLAGAAKGNGAAILLQGTQGDNRQL